MWERSRVCKGPCREGTSGQASISHFVTSREMFALKPKSLLHEHTHLLLEFTANELDTKFMSSTWKDLQNQSTLESFRAPTKQVSRNSSLTSSSFHHLSSCVFCRTKSEVADACIPVPFSHSPYHKALGANLTPQLQAEARQHGCGGPSRLGKTQNCLVTLGWVVCPAWSDPATERSATSPQPLAHEPGDFFLPCLGSAEWIIQVLQYPGRWDFPELVS